MRQEPSLARAASQPCQLHAYHQPIPSRTQGHHRYPQFLQERLWGRVLNQDLLWVCGTCHDNIHEWLGYLLGEARKPEPEPGRIAKAEARRSFEWFVGQGGQPRSVEERT